MFSKIQQIGKENLFFDVKFWTDLRHGWLQTMYDSGHNYDISRKLVTANYSKRSALNLSGLFCKSYQYSRTQLVSRSTRLKNFKLWPSPGLLRCRNSWIRVFNNCVFLGQPKNQKFERCILICSSPQYIPASPYWIQFLCTGRSLV